MARPRLTAEQRSRQRIERHKMMKKIGCVGVGSVLAMGTAGAALAYWLSGGSSSSSETEAKASPTPSYATSGPFASGESTYDIDSTPSPQRSSVDDVSETPSDGWTTDPPEKSPSASASTSKSSESDRSNPCHWDVKTTKRAGKTIVIGEVRGYEECTDGDLRDAMGVYQKPSIESERAFGVSNGQTLEVGCEVRDDAVDGQWLLVRSKGIAGDTRGFIQSSVMGMPEVDPCPADYQQIADGGGRN